MTPCTARLGLAVLVQHHHVFTTLTGVVTMREADGEMLRSERVLLRQLSINQSINIFNVLGGNWDPTDKKFSSVNSYRQDCFLHAKHSLRKPPHAFGSHKIIKSAIVQQCCRRSKCCDLMWLYAGQSNTKCCSSSTQSNDLHTRHSLSVLSR